MSLLGAPLLLVLALLAVALPVLALLLWGRRRRRTVTALAVALLVLGGQLAGVGLVAAALNRSGGYYTSWSQLVDAGAAPPATRQVSSERSSGSLESGVLSAHADPSFSERGQWATRGRLETLAVTGASSGLTAHGYLYLPAQYFQARYRHTRFPGSEVLTGYPGTASDLVHALDYPGVLRSEVAAGRAHPMVLAMLRPSLDYRRDLECTDVPGGPQALTFLAQDLPSAISSRYRVRATRWGAIGDSTGGYCSTKLAMTSPATFSGAVSLSGYYQALEDHTTGDLYGGSRVVRDQNDLVWRLEHQTAPATSVLATISREETSPTGLRSTQDFLAHVKAPLTVDSIITPHGGHNFRAWSALLPRSIDWLSARLATPAASR